MQNIYQSYQAIIFDCDGVLVDSEAIAHQILLSALTQFPNAKTINPDYIATLQGLTTQDVVKRLQQEYQLGITETDLIQINDQVHAAFITQLPLIQGVKEAILEIKTAYPHLKYAIASNSSLPHIQRSAHLQGIDHIIKENIVSASMVAHPKPAPDVYLKAAQILGVSPQKCIIIEDSVAGASAALAAHATVIGFLGASHLSLHHEQILLELGVNHICHTMAELPSLISKILATSIKQPMGLK